MDNRRVPPARIRISPLPLAEADDRVIPPLVADSPIAVTMSSTADRVFVPTFVSRSPVPESIRMLLLFPEVSIFNEPPERNRSSPRPPAPLVDRSIPPLVALSAIAFMAALLLMTSNWPVPVLTKMLVLLAEVSNWREPADLMMILPLPAALPEDSSIPPLVDLRVRAVVPLPPERTLMLLRLAVVSKTKEPADLR